MWILSSASRDSDGMVGILLARGRAMVDDETIARVRGATSEEVNDRVVDRRELSEVLARLRDELPGVFN